jgi:hypothetical protein
MRARHLFATLAIVGVFTPALAVAGDTEWRRYVIPSSGTSVDMPVSIFTSDAGAPGNESPAAFLAKMQPPAGIIYKRITSDFFVVSSIRNDRIWYNRCNRGNGSMNCVMINYPVAEKRQWDGVVTRISRTLRG